MKAVQINAYGGVEVLEINDDASKPTVGEGQVLVEISAASINPFDRIVLEGHVKDFIPLVFPTIIGGDMAGTVVEVGPNVTDYVVGDEIYGQAAPWAGGSGAFAQFATAATGKIAKKPTNIDFIKAASLPLVGESALQALETHIKLQSGQKILIHGAAGGIGSIAVQIAKALGAYVATTVSTKDLDFAKKLGADEVIDYKTQEFEKLLKDYDAVFDTAGGETTNKSFSIVKKGGVVVWMSGKPDLELAKKYQIEAIGQNTDGNSEKLNRLCELVESGKVKPQVDKVYKMEEVGEAFTHLEKEHPRGKVVLEIK